MYIVAVHLDAERLCRLSAEFDKPVARFRAPDPNRPRSARLGMEAVALGAAERDEAHPRLERLVRVLSPAPVDHRADRKLEPFRAMHRRHHQVSVGLIAELVR